VFVCCELSEYAWPVADSKSESSIRVRNLGRPSITPGSRRREPSVDEASTFVMLSVVVAEGVSRRVGSDGCWVSDEG
jgi:hypothetical protein